MFKRSLHPRQAFGGTSFGPAPLGRPHITGLPRAADANALRGAADQALCCHFVKMASHCCVAHLTESSAVIAPVAALAIMSQMTKSL